MKKFAILFCFLFGVAFGHELCEINRLSLGIATSPEDCSSKCSNLVLDEGNQKCVSWMHDYKTEKCSGWVLDTGAIDHNNYNNFYGPGNYYSEYQYQDFTDCGVTNANYTYVPDPKTGEINGCSFDVVDLGSPLDPYDCQTKCETLNVKKYGACFAWLYGDDDYYDEGCIGLVSLSAKDHKSCGIA